MLSWIKKSSELIDLELFDDETAIVKSLNPLSAPPVLYVVNVGEEDAASSNDYRAEVEPAIARDDPGFAHFAIGRERDCSAGARTLAKTFRKIWV